jgi:hypothetical protein
VNGRSELLTVACSACTFALLVEPNALWCQILEKWNGSIPACSVQKTCLQVDQEIKRLAPLNGVFFRIHGKE